MRYLTQHTEEVIILKKYSKSLLAVLATVLSAVVAFGDGGITSVEWVQVAVAAVGAAAVFASPNVPGARYTKSILAALAAVLAFLTSAIVGGIDSTELLQIGVIALGALGVYAVPNESNGVNLSDAGVVV